MKKFAEIPVPGSEGFGAVGVVRCVFDWDAPGAEPEYAPDTVIAVDITAVNPKPEPGWSYDFRAKAFTAPAE